MKQGDRVITQHGRGTVVKQEGTEGVLADRFLVKLDELRSSPSLMEAHQKQGGLYFFKTDLKTNT